LHTKQIIYLLTCFLRTLTNFKRYFSGKLKRSAAPFKILALKYQYLTR